MMADSVTVALKAIAGAGLVATGSAAMTPDVLPTTLGNSAHFPFGMQTSVLLFSIFGALIGVLLLKDKDAGRVSPPADGPWWRRLMIMLASLGALGLVVLCYAVLAGAALTLLGYFYPKFGGAPQSAAAILAGFIIKPILPGVLRGVQALSERLAGGKRD
jgi:hypothetical protein